jgi:hypothetical protein
MSTMRRCTCSLLVLLGVGPDGGLLQHVACSRPRVPMRVRTSRFGYGELLSCRRSEQGQTRVVRSPETTERAIARHLNTDESVEVSLGTRQHSHGPSVPVGRPHSVSNPRHAFHRWKSGQSSAGRQARRRCSTSSPSRGHLRSRPRLMRDSFRGWSSRVPPSLSTSTGTARHRLGSQRPGSTSSACPSSSFRRDTPRTGRASTKPANGPHEARMAAFAVPWQPQDGAWSRRSSGDARLAQRRRWRNQASAAGPRRQLVAASQVVDQFAGYLTASIARLTKVSLRWRKGCNA